MSVNDNSYEYFADLVRKLKGGDESAFSEIYENTKKMVYVTCFGILNNKEDAEDAMQETYINLYNKISDLEDETSFLPWLKKTAANKALDKRKSIKDNASFDDVVGTEDFSDADDNLENLPDSLILEKDKRDTFYKILRKELSDAQFQTILLYYYDELSIADIAKVMDCPTETIKSRLKSARVKIKAGIQEFEKTNKIRLLGAAGTGTLGNFFNSYYGSLKIPAIKNFPFKVPAVPKGAVAAKAAGGKAAAGVTAKAAGGTSLPKVLGIVGASVLGVGAVGGGALAVNYLINNSNNEEPKVYEINSDGLYCDIEKSDGTNNCYRFYPDGELIYTSYNFNDSDEYFPTGSWFNIGSDDSRVEYGTYEVDGNKLEITVDREDGSVEYDASILNNAIFVDDARYKFYEFGDLPGYITEYEEPVPETSETETETSETIAETTERIVSVTDAYYKDEVYEYYPYGEIFTEEDEIERYYFHEIIPQVNISGIDMSSVNDEIMNTVNDFYHIDDSWRGWNNVEKEQLAETDYMYYIGEDVVSVVVRYRYLFTDGTDIYYSVFNISIETGELLDPSEFIALCGLTDEEFFELADASFVTITEGYDIYDSVSGYYDDTDYYGMNKDRISYDNFTPFYSPDGHLCFEGLVCMPGGQQWFNSLVDTENREFYEYNAALASGDVSEPG